MAGRAYNAGIDAANLSKAELAAKIKEHVPRFHVQYSEVGSDPDKRNYIVSNQRLREAGFEARRTLDEGSSSCSSLPHPRPRRDEEHLNRVRHEPAPPDPPRRAPVVGVTAILSAHLAWLARQRFDFFDMSGFLDAGYRVFSGQKLYVDFFYHAGPVHPAMHAASFMLLGFNQYAVLAHLLAVHVLVLGAVFVLARRELPRAAALAIVICVSLTFFCATAHPWYDQNAGAMIVLALLIFELAHPFRASPLATWLAPAACGALVALSFLTKDNIGATAGAVIFAALLAGSASPRDLRPVAAYTLGAIVAAAAVIASLDSPAAFFRDNFEEFHPGDRLSDNARLAGRLAQPGYIVACAAVAAAVILVVLARLRGDRELFRTTLHRIVWSLACWRSGSSPRGPDRCCCGPTSCCWGSFSCTCG
jgi:hypothetical protein